jgi:hypothetical protein
LLLEGTAADGCFLPIMERRYLSHFRLYLQRAFQDMQQDQTLECLVQPIVAQWPAGARAFLAPLAYAFTQVSFISMLILTPGQQLATAQACNWAPLLPCHTAHTLLVQPIAVATT